MSTANVRKSSIFIPLDVLNSQHGCFICFKFFVDYHPGFCIKLGFLLISDKGMGIR
jgi:hypothetical protein